jgi:cytochrome c
MDGWELTKIGTAVGSAILVALTGSWFADQVIAPPYPERRGYSVEGVPPVDLAAVQRSWPAGLAGPADEARLKGYMAHIERAVLAAPTPGGPAAAAAAPVDLGTLLASADPARGASTAKVCNSCHTFDQGGPDRVGPNLWAVVGRPIAAKSGYAYSPALRAHDGSWTYQELDRYLASPARSIPGNKMAFNGVRNPKDRANLLAYLGSLGPSTAPYPPPAPAQAAAAPAAASEKAMS